MLFRVDTEPARLGAGRDDERVAGVSIATVAFEPYRPRAKLDLVDVVHHDVRADMLGLRLHLLHQPWALNRIGEARVVFDVGRDGQLAAGLRALDERRRKHGARGIDGSGVTSRAGAQNDHFRVVRLLRHGSLLRPRPADQGPAN